jgi:hypothetical protein
MRSVPVAAAGAVALVLLVASPLTAHHGSSISYDMENSWTTKATVTGFRYMNPHPWLKFDRVNDQGETEQWTAELLTNPTFLLRAGWTKARSIEALRPGTVVELELSTARAGGFNAIVRTIRNEGGEPILGTGGGFGRGRGRGQPPTPAPGTGGTAPRDPAPPE